MCIYNQFSLKKCFSPAIDGQVFALPTTPMVRFHIFVRFRACASSVQKTQKQTE